MKNFFTIIIASIFILFSVCDIHAQGDENRLARPEWQLRADLEFQIACYKAKDMLCREIIRSIDAESESGSQPLRLKEIAALLELSSDQVPSSLPIHKASLAYIENRKAAVIAWLKTYKTKGRELSKMALDRERAFAFEQSERLKVMYEKTVEEPSESSSDSVVENLKAASEPTSEPKVDAKFREVTCKSIQFLIEELESYFATEIKGDTTAAKQTAVAVRDKAMLATIDKQPSWFLTFPIQDIRLVGEGLELTLDEPLELAVVREKTENRFIIVHEFWRTSTKSPTIIRKWKSIKRGDLLRVRLDVQVQSQSRESNRSEYAGNADRSVSLFSLYKLRSPGESGLSQFANPLTGKKVEVGEPLGFFEIKKSLDMQIVKSTPKAD